MLNVVTVDQIVNIILCAVLLILSLGVVKYVKVVRGFGIAFTFIAAIGLLFYLVAITTTINECDRALYSVISGFRSIFTYTVLCGVCVMFLKLFAGFNK